MTAALSAQELAHVTNADRLLPMQPLQSKHYAGDDLARELDALMRSLLPTRHVEDKFRLVTKPGVTYASLGSDLSTLHFYQILIRIGGYKRVLELGTFIGVSAMFLAEAAGVDGSVMTVERGREFCELARQNILANGFAARIRLVRADALETLRAAAAGQYDFILVDAAKEDYADMLVPALAALAPDGLIVFDDVFMHGDVFNEFPRLDKTAGVTGLISALQSRPADVSAVLLPIGNGLLLVRKERGHAA